MEDPPKSMTSVAASRLRGYLKCVKVRLAENDVALPPMTPKQLRRRIKVTKPESMMVNSCSEHLDSLDYVFAISSAPSVKHLSILLHCPLWIDMALKAFENNATISSLHVEDHDISNDGVNYITSMSKLEALYMDRTMNSYNTNDCLTKAIASSTGLKRLSIEECRIGPAGAACVANMPMLEELWISGNKIKSEGATALLKSSTLTKLEMYTCSIRDNLEGHTVRDAAMTNLDVSFNKIGDAFAEAISHNTSIRTLYATDCKIGSWGAVEMLRTPSITELHCSSNRFQMEEQDRDFDQPLRWVTEHNRKRMKDAEKKHSIFVTLLLSARKKHKKHGAK